MRTVLWLPLLAVLCSLPAAADETPTGSLPPQRILWVPAQPEDVPALELHVASHAATLVQFDEPVAALDLQDAQGHIQLARMGEDSLVLLLKAPLAAGERVPLTVRTGTLEQPLRFVLTSRLGQVDASVRVVRHPPVSADEEGAKAMVLHLLGMPGGRPIAAVPQEAAKVAKLGSRAQVRALLLLGPRLFLTLALHCSEEEPPPQEPKQIRLRATLKGGGSFIEWPVAFFSGPGRGDMLRGQLHGLTALLPARTARLEIALDGKNSLGAFHSLPLTLPQVSP